METAHALFHHIHMPDCCNAPSGVHLAGIFADGAKEGGRNRFVEISNNAYPKVGETALGLYTRPSYTGNTMVGQAPFRIYFSDGETVIHQVIKNLEAAGLQVVKSFDLRSACAPFNDNVCPHHGAGPCDCQLVVLLIYSPGIPLVSLILHSHRGQTELQWDEAPETRPDLESQAIILRALEAGVDWPHNIDLERYADAE